MATGGFGPPRPPLPPAMQDGHAGTSPAVTSRSAASPTGTVPTTDSDPRSATATSLTTTAPSTGTSLTTTAPSTGTSLPAVPPTAPAPPTAGAPQQPQNSQANRGARGEPGGAPSTAYSTSAQIRRRPGAAKAAALARAAGGASDIPVARTTAASHIPVARTTASGVARTTAAGAPKPIVPKVPCPAPLRILTGTMRAATATEGPDRHDAKRNADLTAEFEKLVNSLATIGHGLEKIFAGCGLRIVDKAEKERIAEEEKVAAEKKRNAEQKALEEEKTLSPAEAVIWKNKKEAEKKRKEEEEEKEKRVAFLFAISGSLVNTSTILHGFREIASGSRDSFFAVGIMMRGILSLMAWKRGNGTGSRREGPETMISAKSLGTGALGLRIAIGRHILTREYDGRVAVIDGFGPRKQTISRNLMGTRLITTQAELEQAITDFKFGHLRQLIDVDKKQVSLLTAYNMWNLLCSENLTGILRQNSPLPEMALRARSMLDEENAVRFQLDDIHDAASGLESLILGLRDNLQGKLPKEKLE